MEQPPTPTTVARRRINVRLMIALVLLSLTVPVLFIYLIAPWLSEYAFTAIEEIPVDQIETANVRLFNHPNRLDDVGPIDVKPDDFAQFLNLLRNAEPIPSIPPSAFLGEFRIRLKDQRRGTIRLRMQAQEGGLDDTFASVLGTTGSCAPTRLPPLYRVYFQIGPRCFKTDSHALTFFQAGYTLRK